MSIGNPVNKETILIVDDVPANVSFLYQFLIRENFKVLLAQNGKGAIQKAVDAKPDLILLDIMMPGMDGFEVCQALKNREDTRDIPIIFMTALAETVDKVKGLSLGAVDYIAKPVQHEEVLARIATQLNLRQLQRELKEEIQIRTEAEDSLRQNAKLLEDYMAELQKRNLELEAFARTVAHDLKNPLGAVIGLSEILLNRCAKLPSPDTKALQHLEVVWQSGKKMLNIIDALLLLAGVTQQKKVEIMPLDMHNIVSQVVNQRLIQMVKDYQAHVQYPENWPIALGYAPWIEEIWVNYLSNALKYGGFPPRIEMGGENQETGMVRFWVKDNGPGLNSEAQSQLFTPFMRLHKDRADGHGLGLSIVQQIVEKLGGQTGVQSIEGSGSCFYFTLKSTNQVNLE